LGNRSLLADPRDPDIKTLLNQIKQRQDFRPFAPAILEEYVEDYFMMPYGFEKSPYMQTVGFCRYPNLFPGIVHNDNSSRVQTVGKDSNSGLRDLLEKWFVMTGCPMLVNTSLNIRGEPLVNNLQDAQRFERRYGVPVFS
jgi:carbamoyltransferase